MESPRRHWAVIKMVFLIRGGFSSKGSAIDNHPIFEQHGALIDGDLFSHVRSFLLSLLLLLAFDDSTECIPHCPTSAQNKRKQRSAASVSLLLLLVPFGMDLFAATAGFARLES